MQKKKSKKSWKRHQRRYCFCYLCEGDDSRLRTRTRVRKKFFKYPLIKVEE